MAKILIDLSIPNNIDPSAKITTYYLVNVDDFSKINDEICRSAWPKCPKQKVLLQLIDEFMEWHSMRKNVSVLKAVKQKLIDMHQCNLFLSVYPNPGKPVQNHSSDTIQKVINNMALKMRQQRQPGCNYIEAINDYITSSVN
jgi:glutamyl-tRNA reductase